MREILFRGKRVYNGEWAYGSLILWKDGDAEICVSSTEEREEQSKVIVHPETVGQYTGLTDNNGKKIFEGDIVQYYGTYALEVFIENGHTKTRWFDTVTSSKCTELFFGHDEEALGEVEVIGNIHDNPELLGGSEDAQ